jgi:DNA polymerase III alpha subunit (gram-positive type)
VSTEQTTAEFADIPHTMEVDPLWIKARTALMTKSTAIVTVADQESYEDAEVILKRLTSGSNKLEAFRKKFAQPFLNATRQIKQIADDARSPMEKEKIRLKGLMQTFYLEQERKRQAEIEAQAAEQARLLAEQEAQDADNPFNEEVKQKIVEQTPVVPVTPTVNRTMSNVVKTWVFELENPNNVPREYCSPDPVKLGAAIKKGGLRTIPGVRIFEKTDVRSR